MKLVNIGDGRAAERIVELLDDFFREGDGEWVIERSTGEKARNERKSI